MTTTNLSAVADPLRLYDETFASRLLLGLSLIHISEPTRRRH